MKPVKNLLGVSPSKGYQGTTRGKEKIIMTSVGIEPTTSGLDLLLLCRLSLSFLSKIIEKCVAKQLIDYLDTNDLHVIYQSAYRNLHSTETALIRVYNDIAIALDQNRSVILLLLDLSAAFDTVNHSILLSRLSHPFGIGGTALEWFRSYLTNRTQFVNVNGSTSERHVLQFDVPQGSVLGPLLYSMYTSPLSDIACKHELSFHFYADDTQLYVTFETSSLNDMEVWKPVYEKLTPGCFLID